MLVEVTTFVNPHVFWIFCKKDEKELSNMKNLLSNLEESPREIHTVHKELVLVDDKKVWKRALVQHFNKEISKYSCWLIDYGKILITDKIYGLSKAFMAQLPFVYPACLYGVVPLKNLLDVETSKCTYEKQLTFSPGTIKVASDYIEKAETITFHLENVFNNVFCGSLHLKIKGITLNLIDILVKEKHVTLDIDIFLQAIKISFSSIYQNISFVNDNSIMFDNDFPLRQGLGRGYLRNVKDDIQLPGTSKTSNTEKCFVQNNFKVENALMTTSLEHLVMSDYKDLVGRPISCISIDKMRYTYPHKCGTNEFDECLTSSINKNSATALNIEGNQYDIDIYDKKSDVKMVESKYLSFQRPQLRLTPTMVKKYSETLLSESDQETCIFSQLNKPDSTLLKKSSTTKEEDDSHWENNEESDVFSETSNSVGTRDFSDSNTKMSSQSILKKFKLGCQCESCLKCEINYCDEQDVKFIETKRELMKICTPPPLFKTTLTLNCNIEMKKIEYRRSKIEKDIAPCLLVHSLQLPSNVCSAKEVAFCESVHMALNHLKFTTAFTIQTYAWPAIMRCMNTCLVGVSQSGKSMSYLPAVCTFIIEKESRYMELPRESGPIVIILCESMQKTEETYNLFITILKQTHKKIYINLVTTPIEEHLNIKLCDILVVTPRVLIRLLSKGIINLKRLCHLIIEDADKVFCKYSKDVEYITKGIESMLNHRVSFHGVQVITISEQWTKHLEFFLKKLDNVPIVCISNYLQCAVYARANIQIHFVMSAIKISSVCDIVKKKSRISKTIIICNDDVEVLHISKILRVEGVSVMAVTSNMMSKEIFEQEQLWNSTSDSKHCVLVSTDATLNTQLSITQAKLVIHYSLPREHWTVFTKRFKCSLDNYESPLNTKFQPESSCEIHIYISEDCTKQYPRLCNFLKSVGTKIPQKFINLSKSIEQSEEEIKIENNIAVCKRLKLMGSCEKFRCSKRHILSSVLDLIDWIPKSGKVTFKLLNVQDTTLFGVKLLEYTDTNCNVHKITDYMKFVTSNLSSDIKKSKILALNVLINELYAWYDEEKDVYCRCKVFKILTESRVIKTAKEVLVKLIDAGKEQRVFINQLFELPKCYMKLPPQSVDVYLANILPSDKDESWNMKTKSKVLNIINSMEDNANFVGRILLQIGDTLWLDDIQVQEKLEYSNEVVTTFSLRKKMIGMSLCSYKEQQISNLYKVCENCSIELPNYEMKIHAKIVKNTAHTQIQWAHLEEGYNIVHFCSADSPDKFYVRHQKFDILFKKLQIEIQEMIRKPFYPKVEEVIVNSCYLAQDSEGEEYGRVIIRNIDNDIVDCFFVDFGDSVKCSKKDMKFLPDCIINRLPFQAIECSLYGVQRILEYWVDEAVNILYDHCFESNTDIFKNLYVRYFKSMPSKIDYERYTYSVVLLDDYSNKSICINNMLIHCGFGSPIENENINSSALPEINQNAEEEHDYCSDMEDNQQLSKIINDDCPSNLKDENDHVWDICINDINAFIKDVLEKKEEVCDLQTPMPDHLKSVMPLPTVSHCTPDVIWYQTEQLIKFDIIIPDVQKYSIAVLKKSIFNFSTFKNDKKYKLNFQLFGKVNSAFQHIVCGLFIRVTLTKIVTNQWDRLTMSNQKMRNIKYDVSKCLFPDDNKQRLFLEIEKDEAEDTNNNEVIIEIGSDVDYSESDIETDFESD